MVIYTDILPAGWILPGAAGVEINISNLLANRSSVI